ncbi:MAG TPA: hypothetical protein ENH29_09130 [Bacteroidetes bacterium]|nr:hypothetical protein [Bacteroidota bacterium]
MINKHTYFLLAAIYLFLGFAAVIVQSVLIREFLVIAFGNELVIGVFFAVWFLWIVLGAASGSRIGRKCKNPYSIFWLLLLTGLILFPLQIVAIRFGRAVFSTPVGTYLSFSRIFLIAFVSMSTFSFVIGSTFPLGAQVFRNALTRQGKIIGYLYLFEALGSLAGGVLFSFFLIGHFDPFRIASFLFLIAVFLLVISLKFILLEKRINWLILTSILMGVLLSLFSGSMQKWSLRERWQSIGGKQNRLIISLNTPYDHISVSKLGSQFSLFQNGNVAFSFPDPYAFRLLANLILLQHPDPKRILVISSGISDLLHFILQHSQAELYWLVRDRRILTVLEPLFADSLLADFSRDRLHLIFGDGRVYLINSTTKYDLIYLDLPPPATAALNRYYSRGFFRLAYSRLTANGVLGFQLPVSENYLGEEILQFASSIYLTLTDVFKETLLTSGMKNYLFAAKTGGVLARDQKALTRRWQAGMYRDSKASLFSLYPFFDTARISFLQQSLQSVSHPVRNTDQRPVSYLYNLLLWNRYSGGDKILWLLYGFLRRLRVVHFLIAFVLLFVLRIIMLWAGKEPPRGTLRWNSLMSVSVSGFTAMGLEIILLYGFQNLFGSLYQNIALVTAFFMFGLAIGSWVINRSLPAKQSIKWYFILMEILALSVAVGLPAVLKMCGQLIFILRSQVLLQGIYLFIVLAVGALTGAVFPLAGKGMTESGADLTGSAGWVDAADHSGACLSAFFMGTFFIPLLAINGAVLIIAILNLSAVLLWLVPFKLFAK